MLHSYCVDRIGNRAESEVFFLTLVGDLNRYIMEQTPAGARLHDLKTSATNYYERAERKATKVHHCSPVKMTRDLHHANFLYDFCHDKAKAIKICE